MSPCRRPPDALGIHDRVKLTRFAIREGLLEPGGAQSADSDPPTPRLLALLDEGLGSPRGARVG